MKVVAAVIVYCRSLIKPEVGDELSVLNCPERACIAQYVVPVESDIRSV